MNSSAVTVGTGAGGNSTISALTTSLPSFNYLGSASASAGVPGPFQNGIFSSGGVPAAITLTATVSLTTLGSVAGGMPWLALIGA